MRISDWSSDVCSSDLLPGDRRDRRCQLLCPPRPRPRPRGAATRQQRLFPRSGRADASRNAVGGCLLAQSRGGSRRDGVPSRSEEHTSELQSLMRISYAVFCLKKKKKKKARHYIE